MLYCGYSEAIITPVRGLGLAGYFNERPNKGVYDDLKVKVLLMRDGDVTTGFCVHDLCGIPSPICRELVTAMLDAGITYAEDLVISATHTHTGTDITSATALAKPGAREYMGQMKAALVRAVKEAEKNLKPAELLTASVANNPYSFVRRYWMKNGSVVTNPGKLNPNIVKPEYEFDQTISVIAVRQEGRLMAIMVNLAQHGDTIGGDFVSADWYSRMEREIQYHLTEDVPVLTLMDASGDINHFDVTTDRDQTSYAESLRIGRGYGQIVLGLLKELQPVGEHPLSVKHAPFDLYFRTVTQEELDKAQKYLDETPETDGDGDLTSEGLANGDPAVLRIFAKRTLACADNVGREPDHCRVTTISLGKKMAFQTIPGECFNGIAQAIRKASPYEKTIIIELAQGGWGYLPMTECYARGGYETQPAKNAPEVDSADRLIKTVTEMM